MPAALETAATPLGLTKDEARRRLLADGSNAVADVREHPLQQALSKLWAPVPWMLEAAIGVALLLGDKAQAAAVAVLLVFNAGLSYFQQSRSQATLDALKSRLALVSSVRRDGRWITVPVAELVRDDVVKLTLGAVVPADVRILDGSVLLDQSMLTGESLPVEAGAGTDAYAGALVRRGEARAQVTATGERTKFGRSAELIRTASAESSEQHAIMLVVRNLVLFNGGVTVLLTTFALLSPIPRSAIPPLVLVAILASIPVALPSMFTLAAAIGARSLARRGVLPTRLSAVDEAAGIDILCCDKTGTLTCNALAVTSVRPLPGFEVANLLGLAALASSDGGQDPVDAAIRAASARSPSPSQPALLAFVPFDPALKRAEATVRDASGASLRVVKGAYSVLAGIAAPSAIAAASVTELEAQGLRVLAVAAGAPGNLVIAGLIALSDPPRDDAAALVAQLAACGVRTVMATGDAAATARVVGAAVGIDGPVCTTTPLTDALGVGTFSIFAGILPEDKFHLVKALQNAGHIVGMCGDGANDAPALRQAQMGIAVSTATDVAKSASGIVLTEPGLSGVVATIQEGRTTFQRILTYTLRSITHKVVQVLFLATGLILTGQAVVTPTLMVLMMVTGDFLAMSSSTDNVRPSPTPSIWRIRNLSIDGVILGCVDLAFCAGCLAIGKFVLVLSPAALDTLAVVTLVFSGQAVFYVAREREHLWSSRPGKWLIISSVVDLGFISTLAANGILMHALPIAILAGLFLAAAVFALILDSVKLLAFRRFAVT